MKPRTALVSLSCMIVLCCVVVDVGAQCSSQQSCTPFNECSEFRLYVGKPARSWPKMVQDEVIRRYCGKRGNVYQVCCQNLRPTTSFTRPTSVSRPTSVTRPSSAGRPTGRDLLEKECGKQSKSRISNGKAAEVFEFPWMVLLQDLSGRFVCGGTLIGRSHVLTAAHCLRSGIVSVRVGENDLSKPVDCIDYPDEQVCADRAQDIPVDKTIRHPRYSVSSKKNDIAVIRLRRPAELSDSVKTICLPLQPSWSRMLPQKMIVTGWGFTERSNNPSDVLLYANVPLVDTNTCNRIFRTRSDTITLDNTQLCAGGADDKQDNCKGDSGGPLQFFSNGAKAFVQHGVVAFGLNSCGKEAMPGVYTKVSNYIDWILANLY